MKRSIFGLLFLLLACAGHAQNTFSIWPGPAPGSEDWNWQEKEDSTSHPGDPLTYNIVQPALIYFPAIPSTANGTSVIICPGGSFSYLHIRTEGTEVAKWLNKKGVAAFVLKYRVVHSETSHPMQEKNERSKDTALARRLLAPVIPLAIEDGRQALAWLRKHAAEFGIAPNRIGIMGFSAGGALASAGAFDTDPQNRPDFIAPVYPYVPPFLPKVAPKNAPPLFIAAATDDELHLVPMSIDLYSKWLSGGYPAEIHIYSRGGHGFGMNRQDQPSDAWIDRFGDWLEVQGLLKHPLRNAGNE
jgi:acetyl esterase/lipase